MQRVVDQQTRFIRFATAHGVAAAAAQRGNATSEAEVRENAEYNQPDNDRDTDIDQRLEGRGETSNNISRICVVAKDYVLLQAARLDAARARARAASRAHALRAIGHLLATRGQNTGTAARGNAAHGGWAKYRRIVFAKTVALKTRNGRIQEIRSVLQWMRRRK
jgi:hypothetical protein